MDISKKCLYIYGLIAVFIWIGGSRPALGQEPLSFYQAISNSLENNYDIRIAVKDVDIAINNNTRGAAGMWPSIAFSASQRNQYLNQNKPQDIISKTHDISPGLNLNWVLFGGFSAQITRSKLAEFQNLSEGFQSVVVQNTLQAVILAYQKALLENSRLEVTRELMLLSKDQYKYEQQRRSFGNATTFDLQQARTAYLEDSSNYIVQGLNHRNAMRNLNLIMGHEYQQLYTLSDTFSPIITTFNLAELADLLENNNQTLRNQAINVALMEYDLKLGKSKLYPTFSLNSGITYTYGTTQVQAQPNTTMDPLVLYGNFTLSYNLFNGGQVRRNIANAAISIEKEQLQTKQITQQVKMQLASTFDLYNVRKQLYEVAIENEKLRKMNLELAQEKYRLGSINSINFREVQLAYLNTSLFKLQSIYNLMETYTEIMRLTGGILEEFNPNID